MMERGGSDQAVIKLTQSCTEVAQSFTERRFLALRAVLREETARSAQIFFSVKLCATSVQLCVSLIASASVNAMRCLER